MGDLNGDHLPDLYISNDFFERDYLYFNNGNGTFSDVIEDKMGHISLASMGADIADINNDGFPEIFASEMLPDEEERLKTEVLFENYPNYNMKLQRGFYHQYMHNTLQYNNGDETYSQIAWYSGVAASDWSWGALMFDADNDGFNDIYICNGTLQDVTNQDFITFFADEVVQKMALTGEKEEINYVMNRMPSNMQYNRFFHNNGDLKFSEIGLESGFEQQSFSNGAAYGDLDNDGDLDLVVNNLNQEAFIYQNNSTEIEENHFISIKLIGDDFNKYAIGSQINVYADSMCFNHYLVPSRGFQSSVDYKTVFGLGPRTKIDSISIIWPNKKKTLALNPAIDTTLSFSIEDASQATFFNHYISTKKNNYLKEVKSIFEKHQEDSHVDFLQESLVIQKLSREGPASAKGDINNDGYEDIFIGGGVGQAGKIYLGTQKGFTSFRSKDLEKDSYFEDTYAIFFDADNDDDLDLIVGSGGNHQYQNAGVFQDRLYFNDGNGTFNRRFENLPINTFNTGVICPFDVDGDGDLDLFVGNRSIPMNYGTSPQSYIYENDGTGIFKDATLYFAPFLKTLGMITDATIADIDNDKIEEIIIVGEWMGPVILKKVRSKYEILESNINQFSGWWYAIQSADLDNDGDMDLIMGNRGENFYFTGSMTAPAKLWLYDFDNNGVTEKIITRQINGRDMTVALKKELTEQVSSLYNQNLTHEEFAKKSITELFPKEQLDQAKIKIANWFSSSIAINDGFGNFEIKTLPVETQFSSVNAILVRDLNRDDKVDLILGGNNSWFMPQYS